MGIMENEMEAAVVYWVFIGIMENNMETKSMSQQSVG